ncbi:MAG: acyl carrier protein [Nitrospira sp.]|nr:acyl carrier protein [Nitrospira sp.]MCP9442464.1 acyl carrier protein [Nitrospira sp.]
MTSIEAQVRQYVTDRLLFGRSDVVVDGETSFLESGLIDSTGVLELVAFLEECFRIKVEDEDLVPANLDSVNALVKFIESKSANLINTSS